MRSARTGAQHERAQVLPIVAILLVAFIGLLGLAIDIGRLFVARAELSRALDAAALAGVVELPSVANAQTKATAYMAENQSDSTASFPPTGSTTQFKVQGTRSVDMLFMKIFGFDAIDISASATAGFGIVPVDTYISLDTSGSMDGGCNTNEDNTGGGCPIYEAKQAAKSFVNVLLGSSTTSAYTLVGAGAQRGCFSPPRTGQAACVDTSTMVTSLTGVATTINSGIDSIYAIGGPGQPSSGSGTNVCLGLKKAQDVIFGSGHHTAANTLRFAIILTDGDNVYNAGVANQSSPQSPDSPCQPSSPSTADGDLSSSCRSDTQTQEGKVDTLTYNLANTLKGQGVEVYVVGLSVCGGITSSGFCNSGTIGNTGSSYPDSSADHNLLKCIASSSSGTNDHFFETATASELPSIFTQIAQAIAFRLIE